jgi:hypothetical protein
MRWLTCYLLLSCSLPLRADEPLPQFREVWLDTREVPALLGQGSWSLVPYQEFAQLRDQAFVLEKRYKTPPWITSLHLDARVEGNQLKGLAHLQVRHVNPGNAWLNLQPWSPSLLPHDNTSKAGSLRAGNDPRSVLVRVHQDQQSLSLPVQVDGEERPDGFWFNLQLPASPQSTLKIDVPPGYRLEWPRPRGVLTSTEPSCYSISLDGSSASELTLVVRKDTAALTKPFQECRLDAEFQVSNKVVDARYDLVVQRWHDRIQHLDLALPDGLSFTQIDWKQGDNLIPLEAKSNQTGKWTLTLPEQLDQRVTLMLRARWPVQPGKAITFHIPQVIHASSRATLRIQSTTERLEHWTWGEFTPQERLILAPPVSTGFAMKLVSSGLRTAAPWRSPTARLAPQQGVQAFEQHSSLLLGRSSLLTVHCHWPGSGKPELLQWKVPTGWKVDTVHGGKQQTRPLWHWKPGSLLEVEVDPGSQEELHMHLSPEKVLVEKEPLPLPHLVPQSPGHWTGSYSLLLERVGTLLPPSLNILQSPGPGTISKPGEPTLPDAHWQLDDLQTTVTATGMIRLEPWPPLAQAEVFTELDAQHRLIYRLRLEPLAGRITDWPVRWNAALPSVVWRVLSSNLAVNWQTNSPQTGNLHFPEGLTQPVELECLLPWDTTQQVPLLLGDSATGLLQLPAHWKPATALKPGPRDRSYVYEPNSAALQLVHAQPTSVKLTSQSLRAKQYTGMVVCSYEAELPVHEEPLHLSLPSEALFSHCSLNDLSLTVYHQKITIPVSESPQKLLLVYHLPLRAGKEPSLPLWNIPITTTCVVTLEPAVDWLYLSHPNSINQLPASWLLAGLLLIMAFRQSMTAGPLLSLPLGFLLIVFCLKAFPDSYLPAIVLVIGILLFVIGSLTQRRRLALIVAGCLTMLTPPGQAQPGRAPILIYLIAGKTNAPNDALVIVPASALNQLRNFVTKEQASETTGWWVEQVNTQATRQENTLRWTSTIQVRNQSVSTLAMPWLQPVVPTDIKVNGQPSQLRPGNVAFGLLKHSILIPPRGIHEVQVNWSTPLTSESSWLTSPLSWPGCPVQTLTVTGFSGWLKTDTSTLPLRDGQPTACARMTECRLFLNEPPLNNIIDAFADVAVHWDHRPQQSTMNVLVSYDFKTIPTDKLLLDLPRTVQVRAINLVGEKQALASPRLQRWQLTPQWDSQRLAIQLQRPVMGHVYLLLELPYERTELATLPLTGIEVIGIPVRQSFVAWSGEGVALKMRNAGKPILRDATRFATAWLPQLASLPDEQFLKMQPLSVPAPALELEPLPAKPLLSAQSTMLIGELTLETTTELSQVVGSTPAIVLQGKVPGDCTVTSITGPDVQNWQQSSPQDDKSTELLIWLAPRSRPGNRSICSVTTRRAVSTTVPLETITWQATLAQPEVVHLHASPQVRSLKLSSPLLELSGPWPTASQLATISFTEKSDRPVQLTWESARVIQPPTLMLNQVDPNHWKLTLQASPGATLPEEVQILVKETSLRHVLQCDIASGLLSRASVTPEGILWTLRSRNAVSQLTATCFSNSTFPPINLPHWPAVKPTVVPR